MRFKTKLKIAPNLIDLTPLVDVIFLLLIFFIITSNVLPLKSLQIENPELDKNSTPLTTQILVAMDKQNVIYIGSKKEIVDLGSVAEALQKEVKEYTTLYNGIEPTIVLSIDRRVEYGSFLQLFAIVQESSSHLRLVYSASSDELDREKHAAIGKG